MSSAKRSKRSKVPRHFLIAFNEDDTVKFCIMDKNKVRLPENQDCTVGSQVNVKWQDNNEYHGKVFGMSDDKDELTRLQGTLCNYQSFSEKASHVNNKPDDSVVSETLQDISSEEHEVNELADKFEDTRRDLDSRLSDYEKERNKNIERNNQFLEKLGLLSGKAKENQRPKKTEKKRKQSDSSTLVKEASEDASTKELQQEKTKRKRQSSSSENLDAAKKPKKSAKNVDQAAKLQATLGNLTRAILQENQPTKDPEVVVIDQESKDSFVESSSQSLEFPTIFHPRQQSTPVNKDQRKGDISSDQYHYLHSLIKDQAEKMKTMESEMTRIKAEIRKLKQEKSAESLVTFKSGQAAMHVVETDKDTSLPESSAACKMEESGDSINKVNFLQSSMLHYVTRMEVVRFLMNEIFTQEELKTCSVRGKCVKKNIAPKPMLPAEKRSLLFRLLKERFPGELKSDQECGLAANSFLKRLPGRMQ